MTFYAAMARRFTELCESPNAIRRLAEEMNVPTKTAASWITSARDKGLLTSLGKGRQGGELTADCLKLISDYEKYDQRGG